MRTATGLDPRPAMGPFGVRAEHLRGSGECGSGLCGSGQFGCYWSLVPEVLVSLVCIACVVPDTQALAPPRMR